MQRGGEIPPHGRVGARKNPLLGAAHLPYLRLFQGTCCHRVLGCGRDVPRMPLPSACPQRTPSGHAHTQQRAAAACRPLRLAFVAAAAFILAVGSRKSVRPPNAVPLYDSRAIKRLSCEAWGVLNRS